MNNSRGRQKHPRTALNARANAPAAARGVIFSLSAEARACARMARPHLHPAKNIRGCTGANGPRLPLRARQGFCFLSFCVCLCTGSERELFSTLPASSSENGEQGCVCQQCVRGRHMQTQLRRGAARADTCVACRRGR